MPSEKTRPPGGSQGGLKLGRDSDRKLGQAEQVSVPSGRWTQLNDVFSAVGAQQQALAYAVIEVLSGNGTVWAYASFVDNNTSDPTTIPVQLE